VAESAAIRVKTDALRWYWYAKCTSANGQAMIVKPFSPAGLLRLATAAVPLAGLFAAPSPAQGAQAIAVCSGRQARVIYLPEGDGPAVPRDQRDGGCPHFTCPRDRNADEPGDDDEE
jgi:hypothetical protein